MKNIIKIALLSLGMTAMLTSCEDDTLTDDTLSRLFTPTGFVSLNPVTDGVKIQWNPVKGATAYTIQMAADSTFADVLYEKKDIPENSVEFLGLGLRQTFVARVSAQSETTGASKYLISSPFKTLPYLTMQDVAPKEVTLSKATVRWMNGKYPFTHLCYYKKADKSNTMVQLELTDEQKSAENYRLSSLSENTTYVAYLLDEQADGEAREHNAVEFTTKRGANSGDIIIASNDTIGKLISSLDIAGDKPVVIYIQAGAVVRNISTEGSHLNLILNRNITFRGAPEEGEKPMLMIKEMQIEGAFDSVRFENLRLTSENQGSYMINLKSAYEHVKDLKLVDCDVSGYKNAVIRHQGTEGTSIGTLTVDNSLIHHINETGAQNYALFHFANKAYWCENIVIRNSSFYDCGTNVIEMRKDNVADDKTFVAVIEDCTFNNMGMNTRTMFNFQYFSTGKFNVKNSVFGKIGDPTKYFGYLGLYVTQEFTNNFMTNDFIFATSTVETEKDRPIPLVFKSVECSAEDLFVNPGQGDFSYKPGKAINAGDPRWR
ncbi:MAG: DUF5123 domain-containing protein [Bacteroidales bacterium]